MSLEYLPIMAQAGAPKPPRVLVLPAKQAWTPITRPLNESKVALLSSAALRLMDQQAFLPREDLSFRRIPSDPAAGTITIDHHSGIGRVPKQDPEIVFPRTALVSLAQRGVIGARSPYHFSFMGGVRHVQKVEDELAPAIAAELKKAAVDLALLVPY
jgi:D-proline reductase (dithiol) PrdB